MRFQRHNSFRLLGRTATVFFLLQHFGLSFIPSANKPEPVAYKIKIEAPEKHLVEVEADFPTDKRPSVELLMAAWSPGSYEAEDYVAMVRGLTARTAEGVQVEVLKSKKNRWVVKTQDSARIIVTYQLLCKERSVTTNWVDSNYALLNGPCTYITLAERTARPQEVQLELPAGWKGSMSALDVVPDDQCPHYHAPSFDVLADSPIVAGDLRISEFDVAGSKHYLVDFGKVGNWDSQEAVRKLRPIVEEYRRFFGELPFTRYMFLNGFRAADGALEHANCSLLTTTPARSAAPRFPWLAVASHEYFRAFNVKRLRPIELGPFDYDNPPLTRSLWISEGLTTYYGYLAVARSGVGTPEDFLAGMTLMIRHLQLSQGRRLQTLEQASLRASTNPTYMGHPDPRSTVSYYSKGAIVGFMLDTLIRQLTNDAKCLDDVIRLAYARYSGNRGFTPEEFEATAAEVAGVDLKSFFDGAVRSTGELNYSLILDWFGLRFVSQFDSHQRQNEWALEIQPHAAEGQSRHFKNLMAQSRDRP